MATLRSIKIAIFGHFGHATHNCHFWQLWGIKIAWAAPCQFREELALLWWSYSGACFLLRLCKKAVRLGKSPLVSRQSSLNSVADSCFGFTERFLSFVTPDYARSSALEKVLSETNHNAVTDHRVWFKTTKWAFERFEVKKSSKSISSLAQLLYADWLCMTLYAVVSLTCS